MFGMSIF